MPHKQGDDGRNVVCNEMNKPFTDYALDDKAMEKWAVVEKLRDDVNAVLEAARAQKKIGKALEAHVALHAADSETASVLMQVAGLNLAELFIVSNVSVADEKSKENAVTGSGTNFPGLVIEVTEAPGTKCPRCWMHSEQADAEGLCPRCAEVMKSLVDVEL